MLKVKVKVKGHVIRALLCCHENRRRRGGLLYVFTVYPAESWAPRIRAHDSHELSVRPSVCLFVTLRYRRIVVVIGWNSAKIISRLIRLTFSLSADPNVRDLYQREHPKF